ncbi:MAG: NAD(P)-dependent oxidoreductase [Myxococcota bacterium]
MTVREPTPRVLVTGATGFLGRRVVARLREHVEVRGTGRNPDQGRRLLEMGAEFVPADLTQPDAVRGVAEGIDVVVHCAGLSTPWGRWADFHTHNVGATGTILAEAQRAGVRRFVHISTSSVYAQPRSQRAIPETAALPPPANLYVRSKRSAERLVLESSLPSVILRPRGLFGPEDPAVLARVVRALKDRRLPVLGSEDTTIDLTYVDNAAEAVRCAVVAPESAMGGIYNVTNGEPIPLWPAIRTLAARLDLPPPGPRLPVSVVRGLAGLLEGWARMWPWAGEPRLTRYTVGLLAYSTTLDISKARSQLGYEPLVSMEQGIDRYVDWLRRREP